MAITKDNRYVSNAATVQARLQAIVYQAALEFRLAEARR